MIADGPGRAAAHAAFGMALAAAALAAVALAWRGGSGAGRAASVTGALAVIGAGFNGASFVNYGHAFSSVIMAGLWTLALACYLTGAVLAGTVAEAGPPGGRRGRPPGGCQNGDMLDHVSIQCADMAASASFYDAVLAPLGGQRVMDFGEAIGYGVPPKPEFWIGALTTGNGFRESHLAFTAASRAAVLAFFDAARARGAEVLHEPRLWPEYHPDYYGAFVRDPDGNNVEAVCHIPE